RGRLPLAVTPWAVGPYGLAAGDNPLWAGRSSSCLRGYCHYGWPPVCRGALAEAGSPLQGAWPQPAAPLQGGLGYRWPPVQGG
ncbi:hypothetical protein GW17_00027296, partial [Ensete ventricosum]